MFCMPAVQANYLLWKKSSLNLSGEGAVLREARFPQHTVQAVSPVLEAPLPPDKLPLASIVLTSEIMGPIKVLESITKHVNTSQKRITGSFDIWIFTSCSILLPHSVRVEITVVSSSIPSVWNRQVEFLFNWRMSDQQRNFHFQVLLEGRTSFKVFHRIR